MARPTKQGLDYFSFDCDFFTDIKIRKIARACGIASPSILICLLCNIYKDKGYYILWDEDLPFVIADTVGVTEGAVKEVILKAIQVGFFDTEKYEQYKILTSSGIQKRFRSSTLKRCDVELNGEYLVIDFKNSVSEDKNDSNGVNDVNNSVNDVGSTQSKVKKSKEDKSKEKKEREKKAKPINKTDAAKAATLVRKHEFGETLIPFVEDYSTDMIRKFFDYWSELSKSGTKMRFEKQPTWEVAKRLVTWANREDIKFEGTGINSNEKVGKMQLIAENAAKALNMIGDE